MAFELHQHPNSDQHYSILEGGKVVFFEISNLRSLNYLSYEDALLWLRRLNLLDTEYPAWRQAVYIKEFEKTCRAGQLSFSERVLSLNMPSDISPAQKYGMRNTVHEVLCHYTYKHILEQVLWIHETLGRFQERLSYTQRENTLHILWKEFSVVREGQDVHRYAKYMRTIEEAQQFCLVYYTTAISILEEFIALLQQGNRP